MHFIIFVTFKTIILKLNVSTRAITLAVLLKIFTMSLVLLTGIAIFATYAGCDPVLLGHIKKSDAIVPYFVIKELAFVPGKLHI